MTHMLCTCPTDTPCTTPEPPSFALQKMLKHAASVTPTNAPMSPPMSPFYFAHTITTSTCAHAAVFVFSQALNDAKGVDCKIASGGGRMQVTMDRYEVSQLRLAAA